jgi:type I site-specific restriction endonuclease
MNEADTCRTLVTPKLRSAGWTDDQIREQVTFTHGRIVPSGRQVARKVQKRADYLLYYQSKYRVAVIEAKDDAHRAVDGLAQAKEYAKMLSLQVAYATNGHEILEFSYQTGELKEIDCFPMPEELWNRVNPVSQDTTQLDEPRRMVDYRDDLPPSLCFGDLRQAKVSALPALRASGRLQSANGEELSHRDATQSALMPSILDKAFKGEL